MADQADAFAVPLDHLDVDQTDIIGISAGTTAALQLALRHPDRVKHLVVVSGNLPDDPNAVAPPGWPRLFYNDLAMWSMKRFARPRIARLMGVPPGFPRDDAQARVFPLEQLPVPTLLMHTKDDPLGAFTVAERAAQRIPGCLFVALESGGHLGLGSDRAHSHGARRVPRRASSCLARTPPCGECNRQTGASRDFGSCARVRDMTTLGYRRERGMRLERASCAHCR